MTTISIILSNQEMVVCFDMTQMSHVCLASECSRNNFELLEWEPCLWGVCLTLGSATAPCSKTSSYAPVVLSADQAHDEEHRPNVPRPRSSARSGIESMSIDTVISTAATK